MKRPNMTIADVMADMRGRGFSISQKTFNLAVERGEFPFVRVLSTGATGRKTLLIFRKDYEAWADDYLGGYES